MPDYQTELNKLTPEDRKQYIKGWKTYIDRLPGEAYTNTLTRLTQQFGPDFASELVRPELTEQAMPPQAEQFPLPKEITQPEIPAWQKPIAWAAQQPGLKQAFWGLDQYQRKFVEPLAMSLMGAGGLAPTTLGHKLREEYQNIEGPKTIWNIPEERRTQIWREESGIPWWIRMAPELIVDPTSYFGFGLGAKAAQKTAQMGLTGLSKAISPLAQIETTYMKASELPLKALGAGIKKIPPIIPNISKLITPGRVAGKRLELGKLLEESTKSVVNALPVHTFDALHNLGQAGDKVGKTFSQILEDFNMGVPDKALLETITNPDQKYALEYLQQNSKKLDLDMAIRSADKHPDMASSVIGHEMSKLKAIELGVEAPRLAPGLLGSAQKTSSKAYSLWKRMVLQTPYYALQNTVENWIRQVLVGTRPIWDITDFVQMANLADHPVDIQRRIISLRDRWNKTIPEHMGTPFAKTPATGGITEAMTGAVAVGKSMPFSTVAAYLDDMAIVNTYFNMYDKFVKVGMEKGSKEVAEALVKIQGLYDNAIKAGLVDQKLLEHLHQIALSGTPEDVLQEFAKVQRNKTMTITHAMTQDEEGIPLAIQAKIKNELPRLWAKNDDKGIDRLFEELKKSMPQRIESYQKQVMLQRMKEYRRLHREAVPEKYQPFLTKVINTFKMDRVSEAEARVASSSSLSELQQNMFKYSQASRRDLEARAEAIMITEAIARNADDKMLMGWYATGQAINDTAFKAGDELVDRTFKTANTIRYAKDSSKIAKAWDNYIMEIQSEFPEIADTLRAATPDTDILWNNYRMIQDRRWFNVGQEKLKAMGVDFSQFARVVDAKGNLLTSEDFIKNQLGALDSWKNRVTVAYNKRHTKASAKDALLDNLRNETIRTKEAIELQHKTIRNKASDASLGVTYSTFGNYAHRTNLDEMMMSLGVPFWFFPSRSIPFYLTQAIQKPRLGIEVLNMQNEVNDSDLPARLTGTVPIPGTNYSYNPLRSAMFWQLANQKNFSPQNIGGLEGGMDWVRNNLGISMGPQWHIVAGMVERILNRQVGGSGTITAQPQPIIPQQRWLQAIGGLKLPVVSPLAQFINEPFDMYLRAVYGDTVADFQKREVDKNLVDMGYNPADPKLPTGVIQDAWKKYWVRQLISIPAGAVQELSPTEKARFEAINKETEKLGLTKEQAGALRAKGESLFIGLRQDQLEGIYKDIPAQKLWSYIRPAGLTKETRPIWEDWIKVKYGIDQLRGDKENPQRDSKLFKEREIDKELLSGAISAREWKALYRQNTQKYSNSVEQLYLEHKLAPRTKEDWEAYRTQLGQETSPRHPDDMALDEYYQRMDSKNFENPLTGEFNYKAYKQEEADIFKSLSPETISYIKSRKDKYKTPLRAAYTRDMEKVQPYYAIQDLILEQFPPQIAQVIDKASSSPDPAIQKAYLMGNPMAILALRRIRLAKSQFRMQNPELDKILRFWT